MGKFNLTIDEELKRKAKARAALEGIDLSDVISEHLRLWVEGKLPVPPQQNTGEASNERPTA